jgi:hypothetical protein
MAEGGTCMRPLDVTMYQTDGRTQPAFRRSAYRSVSLSTIQRAACMKAQSDRLLASCSLQFHALKASAKPSANFRALYTYYLHC